MNIAILGAGAWGTALAISLSARHHVILWARNADQVATMSSSRSNPRYLPDVDLPDSLSLSGSLDAVLPDADLVLVAVPIAGLRAALEAINRHAPGTPVVWACKGFESESSKLPHQVADETLAVDTPRGVLSGPSFAEEVARGMPTALTLAAADEEFARRIAHDLHHARLRIYSSNDVVGVEVGGAVKNVLAIAAGIADGMGFGHNARAALISRGLAEMSRLGLQLGGRAETLFGLSGAGDLILTCTGDLSRNRNVGLLLGKGKHLDEILQRLGHVAEGVYTVREVHSLAQRLGVDMPICEAVYRVLYENLPAAEAVESLLNRAPNSEFS